MSLNQRPDFMLRSKTSLDEAVSPSRIVCLALRSPYLTMYVPAAKLRLDVRMPADDGFYVGQVLHGFGVLESQFLANTQVFGGAAEGDGHVEGER